MIAALVNNISMYMGLHNTINAVGMLYTIMIFVWALFSWFDHSKGFLRDMYNVLDKLVGPYVRLFRRFLPTFGSIDFSPFVALIVFQIFVQLLLQGLRLLLV